MSLQAGSLEEQQKQFDLLNARLRKAVEYLTANNLLPSTSHGTDLFDVLIKENEKLKAEKIEWERIRIVLENEKALLETNCERFDRRCAELLKEKKEIEGKIASLVEHNSNLQRDLKKAERNLENRLKQQLDEIEEKFNKERLHFQNLNKSLQDDSYKKLRDAEAELKDARDQEKTLKLELERVRQREARLLEEKNSLLHNFEVFKIPTVPKPENDLEKGKLKEELEAKERTIRNLKNQLNEANKQSNKLGRDILELKINYNLLCDQNKDFQEEIQKLEQLVEREENRRKKPKKDNFSAFSSSSPRTVTPSRSNFDVQLRLSLNKENRYLVLENVTTNQLNISSFSLKRKAQSPDGKRTTNVIPLPDFILDPLKSIKLWICQAKDNDNENIYLKKKINDWENTTGFYLMHNGQSVTYISFNDAFSQSSSQRYLQSTPTSVVVERTTTTTTTTTTPETVRFEIDGNNREEEMTQENIVHVIESDEGGESEVDEEENEEEEEEEEDEEEEVATNGTNQTESKGWFKWPWV